MRADDRDRLVRKYRELDGGELLRLYRIPDELPDGAAGILRAELRLRGIDPDSLEATVPKAARLPEDDGEPSRGEMDPPEGLDVPGEMQGDVDPGEGATREGELTSPELAAAARAARSPRSGSLGSAAAGLLAIAGLVFAIYVSLAGSSPELVAAIACGSSAISIAVSVFLYRKSRVAVR